MSGRAKSELRRPPIAGHGGIISNPYLKQKAPILTIPTKNENSIQSSRSQTTKKKQKTSILNDANCISARDSLFNGGDFFEIEDETLKSMPLYLSQYSQYCAREYKLDDAQKAKEMIPKVMGEINERKANQRTQELQNHQKQNQIDYDQCLSMFDSDTEKGKNALLQKQKEELEKFDSYWENQMPQRYQKSSTHTLQLKFIRKQLILAKQYEQAKQKAKEIELSERRDMEIAQKQLDTDYLRYRKQLINKHKRDLEVYNEGRKSQRIVMEIAQRKEEEVQNKTNGNAPLREKTWKVTKTAQKERGNVQYSGIYNSLSPADDKVTIDTSIPTLMGPAQSTSRKKREVIHKRMKAPKKETNDEENENTQQIMDKNLWGYHVDVNNEMFSLKNQDRNERYLALPKYNQKKAKESKYSKRLKQKKHSKSHDKDKNSRKSSERIRNSSLVDENRRENENTTVTNVLTLQDLENMNNEQKGDLHKYEKEGNWQSIAMDSQSDCVSNVSNMAMRGNSSNNELESESVSDNKQQFYVPPPAIIDINTLQIESESASIINTLQEKSLSSVRKEEEHIITPKNTNHDSPKSNASLSKHSSEKELEIKQDNENTEDQKQETLENKSKSNNSSDYSADNDKKQETEIQQQEEKEPENTFSLKAVALNALNQENKKETTQDENNLINETTIEGKNSSSDNLMKDEKSSLSNKENEHSNDNNPIEKSLDSNEHKSEPEIIINSNKSNNNSIENLPEKKESENTHEEENEKEIEQNENQESAINLSNIITNTLDETSSKHGFKEEEEIKESNSNQSLNKTENEIKDNKDSNETFDLITDDFTEETNNNTFENSHIESDNTSSFISESDIKPIDSKNDKSDDEILHEEEKNSFEIDNQSNETHTENSSTHKNLFNSFVDSVLNSKENFVDVGSQHDSFIEASDDE